MAEFHDVVKLILARMESHPKEFERNARRWSPILEVVLSNCNSEEYAALNEAMRPIRLKEMHEEMMDELLNGDERRRHEQEEQDYERDLLNHARNQRSIGSSLRSTLEHIDVQMEQDIRQYQIEAAKNAYNTLKMKAKTR